MKPILLLSALLAVGMQGQQREVQGPPSSIVYSTDAGIASEALVWTNASFYGIYVNDVPREYVVTLADRNTADTAQSIGIFMGISRTATATDIHNAFAGSAIIFPIRIIIEEPWGFSKEYVIESLEKFPRHDVKCEQCAQPNRWFVKWEDGVIERAK